MLGNGDADITGTGGTVRPAQPRQNGSAIERDRTRAFRLLRMKRRYVRGYACVALRVNVSSVFSKRGGCRRIRFPTSTVDTTKPARA